MIKKDSKTRTIIIFAVALFLIIICFESSRLKTRAYNKAVHSDTFSGSTLFDSDPEVGDVSVSAVARSSTWGKIFDFDNQGLTENNYQAYTSTKDMVEQLAILKRMLIGNILSFAKGIGLHLEDELKVQMIDSEERRPVMYKNQKMMAFNVEFTSNLRLPQYIGLGKGVSVGYGVAREMK